MNNPISASGVSVDRLKALQEIQKTTNEWLRFAEAKNAALLTVDIAILVAVLTKWPDLSGHRIFSSLVIFSSCVIYASAMICMFSFAPQVVMHKVVRRKVSRPSEADNPLYFGHAQKYEEVSWLGKVLEQEPFSAIERYTAQQIIVVSRIASDKFAFFDVGVLLVLSALAVPLIALIGAFIFRALA